ncbi:hypothetical protein ACFVSU_15360 [Microbacterium sp. NPDC058062]|uniref:hypothetical protein n=1 Tax=Microbacterium sp. NPDC058062 TaxID=3346320 RepID=UPI0036DE93B3
MTFSTLDDAVVLAALATLTSMIMIGLGFLYRPSLATLLWSLMFVLVTLSAYGTVIAGAASIHLLGDASAGFAMGAPALVWSGLRADRGEKSFPWLGPVQGVLSAAAYVATDGMALHSLVFSLLYLALAAMAALTVAELVRRPEHGGGRLLPLTIASAVLPVIAVASIITSAVMLASSPAEPALPDLKALGQIAYLTCALVTLLSLARVPGASSVEESADPFTRTAADRLSRARQTGEAGWSLLSVSLDDTETLRIAGGEVAFRRILTRFRADVTSSFPVEADIGADGPHGYLVLVSRPDGVVRDCIRDLLDRVSTVTDDQPLAVEFSASVGWAKVTTAGYELTALTADAHAAMERARLAGGHRWERSEPVG